MRFAAPDNMVLDLTVTLVKEHPAFGYELKFENVPSFIVEGAALAVPDSNPDGLLFSEVREAYVIEDAVVIIPLAMIVDVDASARALERPGYGKKPPVTGRKGKKK